MTSAAHSRYDEVLLTVSLGRDSLRSRDRSKRAYDVLVYTNLDPPIPPPDEDVLAGRPREVGGLRLAGTGSIVVRWSRYKEYLSSFHELSKSPQLMRQRLLETMSSELDLLFAGGWARARPLRIWWSNEPPELDELPWEVLAHGGGSGASISVVRGTPGDYAPLVPLRQGLRLAVIGAEAEPGLTQALSGLPAPMNVRFIDGPLPPALRQAAREDFELVHLVADGTVSLGFDGILHARDETLSPVELRAALAASRVTILALSPPAQPKTVDDVPSVFRAFTHLGSGCQTGPTLVAPVGSLGPWDDQMFWGRFYTQLAAKLSVEEALLEARATGPAPPVALFLRHRLGREFSWRSTGDASVDPARLSAHVKASRELLQNLEAIDARFTHVATPLSATRSVDTAAALPFASRKEEEEQRLSNAESVLESWRKLDEEPQ